MNRTESFTDYQEFITRRKELEDSNKYYVESYCDRKPNVFKLTYHRVKMK